MIKKAIIAIMSICLPSCTSFDSAVIADGVSTYTAISHGATEFNPLLPASAIGAGFVSTAASYVVGNSYPQLKPRICRTKLGAAANNVAVLAGASGVTPILMGVAVYAVTKETCE